MAGSRSVAGLETSYRLQTDHGQGLEVTTEGDGLVSLRVPGAPTILLTEAEAIGLSVIFTRAAADA